MGSPYVRIPNPNTSGFSFGTINKPKIKIWPKTNVKAEIFLLKGEHRGPNKGFGLVHIWAEHQVAIQQAGFERPEEFVASILCKGIDLRYNPKKNNYRLLANNNLIGMAVLDFRENDDKYGNYWSVVTAYRAPAIGKLVGKIC